MTSHSIEIPDPVMVWEVDSITNFDHAPYLSTWTVRAVVGNVTVFEREYAETSYTDRVAHPAIRDEDDARREAARELGEKLKMVLS